MVKKDFQPGDLVIWTDQVDPNSRLANFIEMFRKKHGPGPFEVVKTMGSNNSFLTVEIPFGEADFTSEYFALYEGDGN